MLIEILKDKNIALTKLSELTGISERFLKSLIEEKIRKTAAIALYPKLFFKNCRCLGH